jgi:hypothetical protein
MHQRALLDVKRPPACLLEERLDLRRPFLWTPPMQHALVNRYCAAVGYDLKRHCYLRQAMEGAAEDFVAIDDVL